MFKQILLIPPIVRKKSKKIMRMLMRSKMATMMTTQKMVLLMHKQLNSRVQLSKLSLTVRLSDPEQLPTQRRELVSLNSLWLKNIHEMKKST